jgi:hypothetical protein
VKQRMSANRLAALLFLASALCSLPVAADGWTSSALIGNIQSSSSGTPSSGATTYRELLATAMLAKGLGKPVQFIGECIYADYFKTHYVILVD